MSHAWGEVIVNGQSVGFYEYDGTADVPLTALRNSLEEVSEHWRGDNFRDCTCGQPATPAQIFSDYGGGFWWHGTVCLTCRCLCRPYVLDDVETFDGHPLKGGGA